MQREGAVVEVCSKRLMEEEDPMLDKRRAQETVRKVHSPSAFPNTWELCLGKSGIAPGLGLDEVQGRR